MRRVDRREARHARQSLGEARELLFAPEPVARANTNTPARNVLSVNVAGKSLYVYRLGPVGDADAESSVPTELEFRHKYGAVVRHLWLADGYRSFNSS